MVADVGQVGEHSHPLRVVFVVDVMSLSPVNVLGVHDFIHEFNVGLVSLVLGNVEERHVLEVDNQEQATYQHC
jgi:hypothetical protein